MGNNLFNCFCQDFFNCPYTLKGSKGSKGSKAFSCITAFACLQAIIYLPLSWETDQAKAVMKFTTTFFSFRAIYLPSPLESPQPDPRHSFWFRTKYCSNYFSTFTLRIAMIVKLFERMGVFCRTILEFEQHKLSAIHTNENCTIGMGCYSDHTPSEEN